MKIRSISCFVNANPDGSIPDIESAAKVSARGNELFMQAGIEIQSSRLATQPFTSYFPHDKRLAAALARHMELSVQASGFTYLSLGPVNTEAGWAYACIPEILTGTMNVFCTGIIADLTQGVSLPAAKACAEVIARCTPIDPAGFTNLRFAALANVPPHSPFFPAAYHDGGKPGFSLAMECADIALECMQNAPDISDAARRMVTRFEEAAKSLENLCAIISRETGFEFFGFDFSPAPFPDDSCSLAGAMESLGVEIGRHGSVMAAAILASALDAGTWKKAGFNGMMLPVLEDSLLARRTKDAQFTVKDLLLYSTVCGTGLDTVPLPGDASAEQLSALLLDVAALSIRLDKPLTARLMPIPGKKAGDKTGFDFAFFANGRVMDLCAQPVRGLLSGDEVLHLIPRHNR